MNIKIVNLIACLLLLQISCIEKNSHLSPEVEQVSLTSAEFINDSLLNKPKSIVVTDEFIVVNNSKSIKDSLIDIFNLNGEFISSCVHKGEGPMEALDIPNIQYSKLDSCIYVVDFPLYNYKILRISDYSKQNASIEKVFSYYSENNDSILLSGGAVYLANGQIAASNVNPASVVVIFDGNSDTIRLLGQVPDKKLIDRRLSDFGNSTIYHPFVAISPNGDFAAFFYDVSDMHLIINVIKNKTVVNFVEGKPAVGIALSEVAPGVFIGAVTGKTFCYTQSLSLSNDYIYQLYIGLLTEDLENTHFFKDAKHYGANTVNVYDRDGNHLKTITLDSWVTSIAVSPDDKYLYAITQSSENGYTILRYEL